VPHRRPGLVGSAAPLYTPAKALEGEPNMPAIAVKRPLADHFLPDEGVARVAALAGLAALGSLILWASAKITVPFWPVPMTLQTGAVMLIAAGYGARLGFATVLLYLFEGAVGLPVFADTPAKGIGLAYMLGPTGGYLAGFAVAAALVGWLSERGLDRSPLKLAGAMVVGDAVVFALGLLWLGSVVGWDKPVLAWGLYPFVVGDVVKIALAAALVSSGARLLRR
jgi:biotin transport system substrate-specific component